MTFDPTRASADDLWAEIDGEILRHLENGPMLTTAELAQKLGVSETSANSFLALLALSGEVRIRLAEREPARVDGVRRVTALPSV